MLRVDTPLAKAAVSLFGGKVVSFAPAGKEDVFWLSPQRAALPTPIRGGAPVCWPYFGPPGSRTRCRHTGSCAPCRGSWWPRNARPTAPWSWSWSHRRCRTLALGLRMQLRIGRSWNSALVTTNTSGATVRFTEALHNYFHVADVAKVRIEGLAGLPFHDKNDNGNRHVQVGEWDLHDPRDPGRADRLFPGAGGQYRLVDPGLRRRIDVQVRDGRTAIVWNPGEAAAAKMADVGPHWRQFVCWKRPTPARTWSNWRRARPTPSCRPSRCRRCRQRLHPRGLDCAPSGRRCASFARGRTGSRQEGTSVDSPCSTRPARDARRWSSSSSPC